MRGYVRIHREIESNWVWDCEHSTAQAWIDLILLAVWKDSSKVYNGKVYKLNRGQLIGSIRYLSKRWRWSEKKVRTFVKNLELDAMISIEKGTAISLITICNYDRYNNEEDELGTHEAHKGHTRGTQRAQQSIKKGHTQVNDTEIDTISKGTHEAQQSLQIDDENTQKRAQLIKNKEERINNRDIEKLESRLQKLKGVHLMNKVIEIVDHFNKESGRTVSYSTQESLRYIIAHLKDGHSEDDIKMVISHKIKEYERINSPEWIRLPTILRKEKFEAFLEDVQKKPIKEINDKKKYKIFGTDKDLYL